MQTNINPQVLTWARKRAGLSVKELARKMKKDPKEIERWEQGQASPSYAQLEDLAYRYLKITLAVFFFPVPPDLQDPKGRLRRLPSDELERFSPNTYQKMRLAQTYQDSIAYLMQDVSASRVGFGDLVAGPLEPDELAGNCRNYLGITIERQFQFQSCETAFKAWRHALEEIGIFTFKDSLEDRFVSGFGLLDKDYPIIFINNSNLNRPGFPGDCFC